MPYHVEKAENLIWVRFFGTVTNEDLLHLGRIASETEDSYPVPPPRITDLSTCEGLEISFTDILGVAETRRSRDFRHPFKSAMVVTNDAQRGFARMFQTLMDHPMVTIQIFDSAEAALAWTRE